MGGESRVSRENGVFEGGEAPSAAGGDAAPLGQPTPGDAIPKPADPRATGDAHWPADADVDETLAGGLGPPPDRDPG